ncbi:MAG: flagellar biosynthetic protein FliR [Alphaproteobacteria bacterium]
MHNIGSEVVLHTFLLFCRIGGCLMFMPGFSSSHVPRQARIFIAIAVTLAMAPLLLPSVKAAISSFTPLTGLQLMITEIVKGTLIGLMARIFFLALEFVATMAATSVGFANLPGVPIDEAQPMSSLATMITMTATVLFFMMDLHAEVMRALIASYKALPINGELSTQFNLVQLTDVLVRSFVLALQIGSPFILYAISINVLFGVANKLIPQIGIYFVSLPFVVMGGLFIMYFVLGDFLKLFMADFTKWLLTG